MSASTPHPTGYRRTSHRTVRAMAGAVCAFGLTVALGLPGTAYAGDAAGQALYDEAVKLMAAAKYDEACPKLEEAERTNKEAVGVRLTLADCYLAAGRLASAYGKYRESQFLAERLKQADRAKLAATKSSELEPKLAHVRFTLPAEAERPDLRVVLEGVELGKAALSTPLPIDRGSHELVVSAPGYVEAKLKVEVTSDGSEVAVTLPGLEPEKKAAPSPPPPPAAPSRPTPRATRTEGLTTVGVVGAIGMGVGGLLAIGGAAAGVVAITSLDESNADGHCDATNHCDAEGTDLRNESLLAGDVSTGLVIPGAALLAAGLVMVVVDLTGPSDDRGAVSLSLTPGFVSLGGSF